MHTINGCDTQKHDKPAHVMTAHFPATFFLSCNFVIIFKYDMKLHVAAEGLRGPPQWL